MLHHAVVSSVSMPEIVDQSSQAVLDDVQDSDGNGPMTSGVVDVVHFTAAPAVAAHSHHPDDQSDVGAFNIDKPHHWASRIPRLRLLNEHMKVILRRFSNS